MDDIANYLSKAQMEKPTTGYRSVWTSARNASGRINVSWSIADGKPSLAIGEDVITNCRMVFRGIRSSLRISSRKAA